MKIEIKNRHSKAIHHPSNMNNVIIGIICGIGIPYILIIILVLRHWCCPNACRRRVRGGEDIIKSELTAIAYSDFIRGNLTTQLYREIMHLYSLKGNMDTYIHVSERKNHKYMVEFLKNPSHHPFLVLINATASNTQIRQPSTWGSDQAV
jgi:hypothetical protein